MTNNDLDINDWNPDWENTETVAWATEWLAPDEKLTEDELNLAYITMRYYGNTVGRWYYTEIKQALDDVGIDKFLENKGVENVSDEDKEELRQFFIHWIEFLKYDSELEFEFEGVNEEIGEDILSEIDEEYAKLGQESNLVETIKPTLH